MSNGLVLHARTFADRMSSCIYLPFLCYNIGAMQDWPRHRKECVAVCDNQMQYNVSIMANHSEQLEHYITVTAVLFSPEEGASAIYCIPDNR